MFRSARALKTRSGFGLIFLLILASVSAFGQDPDKRGGPEAGKDNPAGRAAWFLRGRTVQGKSAADLLRKAHQQKLQIRQQTQERLRQQADRMSQSTFAAGTTSTTTSGTTSATAPGGGTPMTVPQPSSPWTNLGPAPITGLGNFGSASGRITAVAVDQTDSTGNTVYVGGAYGGVWKSTNAANATPSNVVWTPLYDTAAAAATLAVGAISIDPVSSSTILVGTGEPDNALDSYYGMGILRSTNGGASWSLITNATGGQPFKGMGVSKFAWKPDGSVVVAGFSNTPLGGELNAGGGNQGIYYSTDAGATWTKATNATAGDTIFGSVTDVVYNATLSPAKFFAAFKRQGIYSSSDGITWTRLTTQPFALSLNCSNGSSPNCDMIRAALTVRPGSAEMYVWGVGGAGTLFGQVNKGIYRTTNGGGAWTTLLSAGNQFPGCFLPESGCGTSQGFYDLFLAAVPNSTNTDLYAGAINIFKCQSSNSTSTTPAPCSTWLNLTHVYGTCANTYQTIHPDQHLADFLQSNPNIIYFGNDGGMYRSLTASTGLNSGSCTGTGNTGNAFQDLNTSSLGSLTQFISISQHPTDDSIILGGTQDNGSPGMATSDNSTTPPEWFEANGGDGGYNEIDQNNPVNWYTTNTDVSIQKCVGAGTGGFNSQDSCIRTDFFTQIVGSTQVGGDHGAFYTPYILDPADQTKLIVGTCRVWRGPNTSTGWPATALSQNFEVGGTTACSGAETNVVRSLAAGGPVVSGVSSVIYAGTDGFVGSTGGRVFVSTNAGAATPTFTEVTGAINPNHFPISKIAIDPIPALNGQTAYITIMGFTGFMGGHVFKTTNAGVSWADISAGLVDAPANSVVVDPNDHTVIYVGTDVGVFATNDNGATWSEYGSGLPNVAVVAMRAFNSGGVKKLRAGTHGRGVWETDLAVNSDYSLNISNPTLTVYPSVTATFNGTLTAIGNYSSPVALSCDAGGGSVPTTCTPSPASQTPTGGGAAFTVNASNASSGDFSFNVKGVGTDPNTTTHQQPVTLHVINFSLSGGTNFNLPRGTTGQTTLTATLSSNFNRTVNATCDFGGPPPTGMGCSVSPTSLTSPGSDSVALTVTSTSSTPTGVVNVNVTVTDAGDNTQTHTQTIAVTVQLNPDFSLATTSNIPSPSWPGQSPTGTVTLSFLDGYAGTINLSCAITGNPAHPTCSPSPASRTTAGTITVTADLTSTAAGDYTATLSGNDGSRTRTATLPIHVIDYTLSAPTSASALSGTTANINLTFTPLNSAEHVTATCNATAIDAGATCSINSGSTINLSSSPATIVMAITVPGTVAGGTVGTVHITTNDTDHPATTHNADVSVTVLDFSLTQGASTSQAVAPGQTTANYNLNVVPGGGFNQAVTLSCIGLPAGANCSFSANPVTPSGSTPVTFTVSTTGGTTPTGDVSFKVRGTVSGVSKDSPSYTLQVQDFSLAASPSSQTINAGQSATVNLTLTSLDNFSSAVTITCAVVGTPAGTACNPPGGTVTPTGGGAASSVTFTSTVGTVAPGTYSVTVTGTGGGATHSQTVSVTVRDFSLSVTPATQTVQPGTEADYTASIATTSGFASSPSLTCAVLTSPAGTSCAPDALSVAPGGSTTLRVTSTNGTTPDGSYTLRTTATSGSTIHTQDVTYVVSSSDFTITTSTPTKSAPPGTLTSYKLTVTATGSFASSVTLSCSGLPANVTCSSLAPFVPSATGTNTAMTLNVGSAAILGTYQFQITGTGGGKTHSITLTLIISTLTLTNSTASQTVQVGSSTTYSLSLSSSGSTSPGTVTMSCAGPLPTGVGCSFSPASLTPTSTATPVTATVTTTTATPAGSYVLTFQGTATAQTVQVTGALNAADFSVGVSPASQTIATAGGGSTTYTVTLTALNGVSFPNSVTPSCTGLPAGWSCAFSVNPVTPTTGGANTTLTLTTTSTPTGSTTITVQGASGALVHTQTATVINGLDYTLVATPSTVTVQEGSSNTTTISATTVGGFSSAITLTCTNVSPTPAAGSLTCSNFSGNPFTPPGGSSALTLSATANLTPGSYTVTVSGTGGGITHTKNATVNVPDYTVGLTGASSAVFRGQSLGLNGTATAIAGFSSPVTFTCSTGDANDPCVVSNSPVTPTAGGAPVTVTASPNGSAITGARTVTLSGDDGAGHARSATFGITVEDFAVAATDANLSVEAGTASGSYSGSVTGSSFTGNVALSCSSASITVTCAFSPSSTIAAASGGGTGYSFTITPDPAAAVGGPYAVTITGTVGSVTRTATVHITVLATQDWSYNYHVATPQSQTINAGQSASYNIDLTPNNGFASSVSLTCAVTGAPAGVGCSITGSPLTPPGTITLNVTTTVGTVAAGAYSIVVTGTGGGKTRTTTATLTVRDFSLSVTPATQTVQPGTEADYTASIVTTSSFPSSPALTCAVLTSPAGTSCAPDALSVAPGGSTTLRVTSTNGTTPDGSYTLHTTATSGSTIHTQDVTYVVSSSDFTITTSTPTKSAPPGTLTSYKLTVTATGSFASSVTLSCANLPANVSCFAVASFVPSATGTNTAMTLNVGSAAIPGTYQFNINATGGGKSHSITVTLTIT